MDENTSQLIDTIFETINHETDISMSQMSQQITNVRTEEYLKQLNSRQYDLLIKRCTNVLQMNQLIVSLMAIDTDSSNIENKRDFILAMIKFLLSTSINHIQTTLAELVHHMIIEITDMPITTYVNIISLLIKELDFSGCSTNDQIQSQHRGLLDILSSCLPSFAVSNTLVPSLLTENKEVESKDYFNDSINYIVCSIQPKGLLISSLEMFRNMNLSSSYVKLILSEYLSKYNNIPSDMLPDFIYNMLLFASPEYYAFILLSLLNPLPTILIDNIQVSSIILNQIIYVIKQNTSLIKTFMDLYTHGMFYNSFYIYFLLIVITTIPKYHNSYLHLLTEMEHSIELENLTSHVYFEKCVPTSQKTIQENLCFIANLIPKGMEEYLGVYIDIIMNLIINVKKNKYKNKDYLVSTLLHSLVNIYIHIYTTLSSSLNLCLSLLVTKICQACCYEYIYILKDIIVKYRVQITNNRAPIKELIEYIPYIPYLYVSDIISAIFPLMLLCNDINDTLFIILRKCMFQKDANIQLVCIHCYIQMFIEVIKQKKSTLSLDSLYMDYSTYIYQIMNESSMMKATIGSLLFKLSNFSSSINNDIYKHFESILNHYIHKDSLSQNPLVLPIYSNTTNNSMNGDPFEFIVYLSTEMIRRTESQSDSNSSVKTLKEVLNTLYNYLITRDTEEWGIDKTSIYVGDEGATNRYRYYQLYNLYIHALSKDLNEIFEFTKETSRDQLSQNYKNIIILIKHIHNLNIVTNERLKDKSKVSVYTQTSLFLPQTPHILGLQLIRLLIDPCPSIFDEEQQQQYMKFIDELKEYIYMYVLIFETLQTRITLLNDDLSSMSPFDPESPINEEDIRNMLIYSYKLYSYMLHNIDAEKEYAQYISKCIELISSAFKLFIRYQTNLYIYSHPSLSYFQTIYVHFVPMVRSLFNNSEDPVVSFVEELINNITTMYATQKYSIASNIIDMILILLPYIYMHISIPSLLSSVSNIISTFTINSTVAAVKPAILLYIQLQYYTNSPVSELHSLVENIYRTNNNDAVTSISTPLLSYITESTFNTIASLIIGYYSFLQDQTSILCDVLSIYTDKNKEIDTTLQCSFEPIYALYKERFTALIILHTCIARDLSLLAVTLLNTPTFQHLFTILYEEYKYYNILIRSSFIEPTFIPSALLKQFCMLLYNKLTPNLYVSFHLLQHNTNGSHLKSQGRLLPNIIYRVETFEQSLLLSKTKTKGILDLTRYVKRSTSRDFKIKDDIIDKVFRDETTSVTDDQETVGSTSKRRRREE